METYKLRVKVGLHEFEAEGSKDAVIAQFESWKALIEATPKAEQAGNQTQPTGESGGGRGLLRTPVVSLDQLNHIFSLEESRRLVTLRVPVTGDRQHADAVLLILYGFRRLRDEDEVQATRLMNSLESSGPAPGRIDRYVAPYMREGLLISTGVGKGKRYRLTNRGIARAEEMIKPLLEQLS